MSRHPGAGTPAPADELVDLTSLLDRYHDDRPDPAEPSQRVAFGTSGHRGSSLRTAFNQAHILAITAAIVRYRAEQGIDGPLFLGRDTHALSEPAERDAVAVLLAAGVEVRVAADGGATPTPAISHAILAHNRDRRTGLADGIVVTPSHNPPEDGGFKYNPPHGGPAGSEATSRIQAIANELLADPDAIARVPLESGTGTAARADMLGAYLDDLAAVLDLDVIRDAGVRIGADPLGGATIGYWEAAGERLGLDLEVVGGGLDPRFAFVPRDWDGRIRMDCSSPDAMAGLVGLKDRFDIAVANDPDGDRHGIVTRSRGLLNPNHYLAVAIAELFATRDWPGAGVGKTLVSSSMIDRVAADLGRRLVEVPVGFKWFVDGLRDGSLGFGGEESAGASFLRFDASPWSTDKDGILLALLAAEILARTGEDPGERYAGLVSRFGDPVYRRVDAPASPAEKAVLAGLSPADVPAGDLAGDPIVDVLTAAPGNGAAIGGLKVTTAEGWFAARPSGTEDVYKIYAESFRGPEHLDRLLAEAQDLVSGVLAASG